MEFIWDLRAQTLTSPCPHMRCKQRPNQRPNTLDPTHCSSIVRGVEHAVEERASSAAMQHLKSAVQSLEVDLRQMESIAMRLHFCVGAAIVVLEGLRAARFPTGFVRACVSVETAIR
eukprot:3344355-Amphidinium_carterae.1